MPHIATTITRRETIAEGMAAFHLEKPPGFSFKAGQYLTLSVPGTPETHDLSIASAPHDPELVIATRIRDSAFKNILTRLPDESSVSIDGPFGGFILHHDANRPAVMIAGGIGITPFFSMALHVSHVGLPHQITIFHANRRKKDIPFLNALRAWERGNAHYEYVPTLTQESWDGETDRVDGLMLARHIGDLAEPIYYIAGSPTMAATTYQMLVRIGINPDAIRTEEFAGY